MPPDRVLQRLRFAAGADKDLVPLRLGERLVERRLLRADAIPAALDLQRRWGCRFGEALVAEGAIHPLDLCEALADAWGLPFVDLIAQPPDATLCKPAHLDVYLARLFLPWRRIGNAPVIACVDPTAETRALIADLYGPEARIAVTAKFDILWTVERIFRERLELDATFRLDACMPQFSARRVTTRFQRVCLYACALVLLAGVSFAPNFSAAAALLLLSLCYLANIALRLMLVAAAVGGASLYRKPPLPAAPALDGVRLPVYSILAPLYREANMVARLADALKALDYPATKLDIKLIVEDDDAETMEAARSLRLDNRFEILTVPKGMLRTKPRACNYALRFARGTYLVIYDAEDRPEPDQLKKAVAAFRGAAGDVACFQARLEIYNVYDNWLTRMFALEYAAWFDFLLPGLSRLGVPIPLGGTSNHFRTETLRAIAGWDAFNVTEDADLGVRLARLGYRVLLLDSSTHEEAIPFLGGWIRQRSRWLKGYMQTGLVHLRDPRRCAAGLGAGPFCGFAVFIAGAVLTAFLAPLFWTLSLVMVWTGSETVFGPYGLFAIDISALSLVAGNGVLTAVAILTPLKRGWTHLMPYGATVFFYWLLMSVAAYKALWQLVWRPFYWEKSQHGALRRRKRGAR